MSCGGGLLRMGLLQSLLSMDKFTFLLVSDLMVTYDQFLWHDEHAPV